LPWCNPACRTAFRATSKIVRHQIGTLSSITPERCPPSVRNPVRHGPERATSARKSRTNVSMSVKTYGSSDSPTCLWSPLGARRRIRQFAQTARPSALAIFATDSSSGHRREPAPCLVAIPAADPGLVRHPSAVVGRATSLDGHATLRAASIGQTILYAAKWSW
jgi:hypothetical protein